jgi:hypothetical protein
MIFYTIQLKSQSMRSFTPKFLPENCFKHGFKFNEIFKFEADSEWGPLWKIDYFSQLVQFERTENGMGLGSPVPINNFLDSSRVSRKM